MDEKQRSQKIGGFLILLGVVSLLGSWLPRWHDMEGPVVLMVVGVGLLLGWARSGPIGLLVSGACTVALGLFAFADDVLHVPDGLSGPLFFLAQAAAFYCVHALDRAKPVWAARTAWSLAVFGVFVGAVSGVGLASKVALPGLMIVAGLWLFLGRRI